MPSPTQMLNTAALLYLLLLYTVFIETLSVRLFPLQLYSDWQVAMTYVLHYHRQVSLV